MDKSIIFSCVIPSSAKDFRSQNLKDLIASIKAQDFPQDQIEILVITEGDSEQAKGIGIKRAKGEICAMFCADNKLMDKRDFGAVAFLFNLHGQKLTGIYSKQYRYVKDDNSLNRYFSLIGNNDPIAFYLNKCDRKPYYDGVDQPIAWEMIDFYASNPPSLGDNGFYIRRPFIMESSLDNYYPMDACLDMIKKGHSAFLRTGDLSIWHRTSDNLISFLIKRYKYARDLYSDRKDRRWRIIDTTSDKWRLAYFVLATLTVIQPLSISIRGFSKIKDLAWFWHWPVCFGFLVTYTLLAIRNLFKHGRLFQCAPLQPA